MDRLFDQVMGGLASPWGLPAAFTGPGVLSPRVDLAETDKGLEVTAELPGIEPKNVTIEIEAGVLTLRAERSSERREEDKDKRWHLIERQSGTYLRRFALPFDAEADKVEARFDKGVLIRVTGDIIALSPPLIIDKAQIDQIVETIRNVLDRLE
jgi:HSP20 family protein